MSIDPRLTERRKVVAEQTAQRNVGRLLRFLLVVVGIGGLVWLAFSPWLSVRLVQTTGIVTSTGNSILVDHRVVAGTPMIRIDAAGVERSLLEDPWISSASVELDWPDQVMVEVVERRPVAWTNTSSGWTRRAIDGVALPSDPVPDEIMARIDFPTMGEPESTTAAEMLGALTFVESLPEGLRQGTVVTIQDDELWATVSGFQVRLGRSVEMREKALSLAALLNEDVPGSSVLILIAPTNPAIMTPGPDTELVVDEPAGDRGDDS